MAEEESANDPQFLGLLRLGWDITIFVVKPLAKAIGNVAYYLAFSVVFVLRLIWRPLEFLFLPLIYLGDFILQCLLAPFRFLARFETLYIYLGIAALIGVAGGLLVTLISGGLQHLLGLDAKETPRERVAGEHGKSKQKQNTATDFSSISSAEEPRVANLRSKDGKRKDGKRGKPRKTPTILEELDSDY